MYIMDKTTNIKSRNKLKSKRQSKTKRRSPTKPNMLVVFDIDETLIHFVSRRYVEDIWDAVPNETKDNFDYIIDENGNLIIFRPYVAEYLKYLLKHKIKIALWTFSDSLYAQYISQKIINHFELKANEFLFVKSIEDMQHYLNPNKHPKLLNIVYHEHPQFNASNTILVDNLITNLNHEDNYQNSIHIQSFEPFIVDKSNQITKEESIKIALEDTVFDTLLEITKKLLKFIKGKKTGKSHNNKILSQDNIQSMQLSEYTKNYENNVHLLSIGDVTTVG